jgi:eukaryotic-like serine/threonine-protein kinase
VSVLKIGDRVDRFVVEAHLGEGGIARVYKVRHHQLGTVHALKMMALKSESLTQRLVREGRIQANLSHPGVVTVTDIIEHEGFTGLLMEYVQGRSLDLVLGKTGAPPLAESLALFRQVLAGVAAAHDAGVLHRDLKPGNVLLEPQGDGVVAKVTDFGIAKMTLTLDDAQTHQSDLIGTPGYMAPEQADDPTAVDARADVYSLGAVLYCLVTGRPPFPPASLPTLLAAAREGSFPPVAEVAPHVPEPIARVVERCLSPDPADRYADCRGLAEALYGDGGPTFDAEVAGARPAVLHVPGAVTPAAETAQSGGADTRVPPSKTWAAGAGPDPDEAPPLEDPGPAGKYIFFASAAFVVAALGWLMFQTWSKTGSVVLDPERARVALEAQAAQDGEAPAGGPVAPVPAVSDAPEDRAPEDRAPEDRAPEDGAMDPGLDAPTGPVAPLGVLGDTPELGGRGVDSPSAGAAAIAPASVPADGDGASASPDSPDSAPEPAPPALSGGDAASDGPDAAAVDAADAAADPGEPELPGDDAVADAGGVAEASAEAAPPSAPAAVDLRGTWTGKLGGRPLTLRIMDAAGGTVSAEIDVLVGTSYRTFQVRGPASDGGMRLSLAEASGAGWRLDGRFAAGTIDGTILPPGRKRGQAFSVRRQ